MIDAMFQQGTDAALDDQVLRPKPVKPDAAGFKLGGFLSAAPKGVSAGSTESAAFAAEILGAFGDVQAATGTDSAGGMFATQSPEERKQAEVARNKLALHGGPEYSNPAGDMLRERAKDMMPDPNTSHASEQVVAGFTRFAGKAVGYAAGAGPLAPALLGADEALTEADKLKQQGVDISTRTKAGAVAGVAAGAAVALPVVGKTVAQTVGLVAVGGPLGFMGQNAAERAILEHAGYDKQAAQYDPLDPVGLALSTLVPAGFGAVAMRSAARAAKPAVTLKEVVLGLESGGRRYGADGKILEGPMTRNQGTAKGEMQVVDATNTDPGYGVRPAADNSPAERARVGSDYLDAMLKRYGSEDKAMAAYNAGPGALDAALKKGGNWLDHMPAETQKYVKNGMAKLGGARTGEAVRAAVAADPDIVAAARVRQVLDQIDSARLTPANDIAGMDRHTDAVETAHMQLMRGEPVVVDNIVRPEPTLAEWFGDSRVRGEDGAPLVVYHGTNRDFGSFDPAADKRHMPLPGMFFSADPAKASIFAGADDGANVRPVHLALHNPAAIDLSGVESKFKSIKAEIDHVAARLQEAKDAGHDGAVISGWQDGSGPVQYVAFKPEQIRSAIGGTRKFDDWVQHVNAAIEEMRAKPEAPRAPKAAEPARAPDAAASKSPFQAAFDEIAPQLTGKQPGQLVQELKTGGKLSPLANNVIVGLAETGGDPKKITSLVQHADALAKEAPGRPAADVMADAIERMRTGAPAPEAAKAEPHVEAMRTRAEQAEAANPDMPVRMSEDGERVTALQELEAIRKEAAEGTDTALGSNDAPLLQVAANCFLGV